MDLTTKAAVRAKLSITSADAALDAILDGLILEVSQDAADYLGRHAQSTARTEVYPLDRFKRILSLRGFPIGSVTSVKYSSDPTFTDVTALDTTDYYVWTARGQIEFLSLAFWYDPGFVQVVSTGGMAASTAAFQAAYPRIAGAVENEVINRYNRRKKPDGSVVVAGNTAAYEKQLQPLDDLYAALNVHRRIRL